MPVTFKIAPHDANPVRTYSGMTESTPQQVLEQFWSSNNTTCKAIIQTSLKTTDRFLVNKNGFVNNVIRAYCDHNNLIIRPDDIWISILSQFNLYVNQNAEDLRKTFVAHEGQKSLVIETDDITDFGVLAQQFGRLLEENINDPSLREWIMPAFTTTTDNDKVVSSIMMMSTLKAYFSYGICTTCGIPSITLLGEKKDYETIYERLSRLEEFGVEPAAFAQLLGPVITEFIEAFDVVEKGNLPNPEFWQKMCHYRSLGSGKPIVGGWITAFCVWDKDGKWQGGELDKLYAGEQDVHTNQRTSVDHDDEEDDYYREEDDYYRPLIFKGLRYPVLSTSDVPVGYCEVDVKLDERECMMVAGHVGAVMSGEDGRLDTLQPAAEWFMFEKGAAPPSEMEKFEEFLRKYRLQKDEMKLASSK